MTLERNSVEIKFTCICESQLTQMRRYWVPRYVGVLVGFFVCFVNMTQAKVIWKEGTSTEKRFYKIDLWASLWGIFWISDWRRGWGNPGHREQGYS